MGDFDRLEWARRLNALREATPAGVSDQTIALDMATEAHAAGYAQAECDMVALLGSRIGPLEEASKVAAYDGRMREYERTVGALTALAAFGHAVDVDKEHRDAFARLYPADHARQGAHRGAAKDEAPRGEEE